jgi:formate dehydrogenase subunit gamma
MIARIVTALALALMLGSAPALAQGGAPAADTVTAAPEAASALRWTGGIAVIGMPAILALFFLARGRIRVAGGLSGRTIQRFNAFERLVHWMTAASFVVLAVSGLNLAFGPDLLLPLLGPEVFAMLTFWGHRAHTYLAFPFTLGVALMALLWLKHSIPNGRDVAWLAAGGGLVGSQHPEAGRFNAGQKAIIWITVIGGALAAGSGSLLLFPALADPAALPMLRPAHGAVGLAMTGAIILHAYLRSVGMEGAFDAMGSGQVDLNWAKQHHSAWVEEEVRKARVTVAGRPTPKAAGAD